MQVINIRHHTKVTDEILISLPKIAVKPHKKTQK